jgi:Protein of unknown function (DUF3043)
VGLLRRSATKPAAETEPTSGDSAPASVGAANGRRAAGKGRPTPKRREADPRPRGPAPPPPRTRREAYRRMREQNATRRSDARQAARRGDERYLPARDRGPVRAFVRDVVDARRNAGGMFLVVAAVVFAGYFTPSMRVRAAAVSLWMVVFLLIIVDSVVLGLRIRRLLNQRFPDRTERTFPLVWYGVTRATMIRRWRMPKPRVQVGDAI